ncbi:MAG TPA: TonB-dependent receptor plug domain-containing protein, partial [Chitinophagaceae bacterium]|nr:TonB-dependent receptor plug domain-containing protein [Chitinophagaceae bacterium]
MKLLSIFLIAACLSTSAAGYSQTVSFSGKDVPLKTVFNAIEKQTGFVFFYDATLLNQSKPVTLNVSNTPIEKVLELSLAEQPLEFTIENKTIFISLKQTGSIKVNEQQSSIISPSVISIKGRITDEAGEPVQASIIVKGTQNGASSNADGYYELKNVDEKATLVITGVGIEPQEIRVNSRVTINVTAKIAVKEGDEVVVAYGRQKQQAITGSVTVVKGEQIQNLPNRSFDKSLQGLVPGLLVTPGTGQPGGGTSNFLLRGIATNASAEKGSIVRNPLIVIDGVPVSQETTQMYISNANTPINNPLAQLNPSDIESISVLKDAAAIAL